MHPSPPPRGCPRPHRKRGSVLLVAVILGAGIALSFGAFIALALNSSKLSHQAFYANSALNLAEAGLEQALSAMNNDSYSGGWTVHSATGSNSRYKSTSGVNLGQGAAGEIRVLIYDITANVRRVLAEGRVTPKSGPPIRKQIEIYASRRSLFANGLVAKDQLTFNANTASVDSWNSDPDNDASTPAVPYSEAVSRDHGSVASNAVTVVIGNADIWGFVGTGGGNPNVGNNGTISDFGTPKRSKVGNKDATRVDKTFKHDFPPVDVPTGVTFNTISSAISGATTLPASGDITSIDPLDGVAKYFYQLPGISIGGNASNIIQINDKVVLMPTAGSGSTSVSITGNASIRIASSASLAIYTEADVSIAGRGVTNGGSTLADANPPKNFQLWGTNTSLGGQSVSVSGNGVFSGIGYVPNGSFTVNGGGSLGDVMGAFVAKTVNMNGGVTFHYDESLKNLGGKNPFGLTSWRELLGAEIVAF